MAGVPAGGHTLRNILIGVGTTVVAYGIIHFLFKKEPQKEVFAKRKTTTVHAFETANDYIIKTSEKFQAVECYSCDDLEKKMETTRELNLLRSNLQKLSDDPEVDPKMRSLIELFKEQVEGQRPIFEQFYDSIAAIASKTEDEQQPLRAAFAKKLSDRLNHVYTRDSKEISDYLTDVNKEYKTELEFRIPETPYDTAALAQKWRIECSYYIDLKPDRTVNFTSDKLDLPGKWRRSSRKLFLDLDNGEKLEYTIEQLSFKFMRIRFRDAVDPNSACPVK